MTQENKEMLQQSTAIMKTKYANAHHAYLLPPYFGAAVFFSAIHEIKKISVILNRQQIKDIIQCATYCRFRIFKATFVLLSIAGSKCLSFPFNFVVAHSMIHSMSSRTMDVLHRLP